MNNKKSDVLISVVIPALNEEKYIGECLESLQKQDFSFPYEIVVVDNGSVDKTAQIAEHLGARVIFEPKQSVIAARQAGTMQARGEIVISADADCTYPSAWLKNIYSAFTKRENITAAFGPFLFTSIPKWGRWGSKIWFKIVRRFYEKRGKIIYVPAANFAFRKSAWSEIGGYNTNLAQGGDEYDLLRRLRKNGPVVYLPDNCIEASSRRLAKGILHSLFVGMGVYYFLDYFIASRITGKSVFGQWKPSREPVIARKNEERIILAKFSIAMLIVIFSLMLIFDAGVVKAKSTSIVHRGRKAASFMGTKFHHLKMPRL